MTRLLKPAELWMLAIALFITAGCNGGASIPTADVSGVITLDDKPLANVEVNFVHEESGFSSYGKTDSTGAYTLVQGAGIGKNKVFFSKVQENEHYDDDPESGLDDGQFEAQGVDIGEEGGADGMGKLQMIPDDFTAENSKLTWDVTAGGTSSADFKLSTPK